MPFIVEKTISATYLKRVQTTPNHIGFRFKQADQKTEWNQLTFREFDQHCRLISFGLMGLGIQAQDKVGILSGTRIEWPLCDMAILGAGAITVPIYASNRPEDAAFILNEAEVKVLILDNLEQLEKILAIRDSLPHLLKLVVIEPAAMRVAPGRKDVLTLQALTLIGKRQQALEPTRFEQNLMQAAPSDLFTICYTSGTTGIPKGVMLSHANMVSVLEDCVKMLSPYTHSEQETLIAFLPFSHILGKLESIATYTFGWCETYAENLDKLMENIAEARPTVIFAVPRMFEKAYARIMGSIAELSTSRRKITEQAFRSGRRYFEAVNSGKRPSLKLQTEYALAKRLVFNKILKRFGGRLKFAISGGAPLPKEIGEFFQILGINVLEGYGLTETCAPISVNLPGSVKFGTVGKPLPEVSIKIGGDGEILIKTKKNFVGYYKHPVETAETLEDAWLHTGDIGYIDESGYLHITDRKKDLIVTSGGKNIAPQKIENLAKAQKYIAQFVVQGDRRNYLTALVNLDREQVTHYANENQILFSDFAGLTRHPKIQSLVQRAVNDINSQLSSFETIKKFKIISEEFGVATGELSPSLKVRRKFVSEKFKAELDSLYLPEQLDTADQDPGLQPDA